MCWKIVFIWNKTVINFRRALIQSHLEIPRDLAMLRYLDELVGATGQDLRDLRMSAVLIPVCVPIWGADVLFLDFRMPPHRCDPGCGPCSEHDLSPLALNRVSLFERSCSRRAAISLCTSSFVVEDITHTYSVNLSSLHDYHSVLRGGALSQFTVMPVLFKFY